MPLAFDIIGNGLISIPGDDPDGFIRFKQVDEVCAAIFNASKLNFAWYVNTYGSGVLWTSHKINRQGKNKLSMFFYANIDLAVLHDSEQYQEDVLDMLTAVVGRADQWKAANASGILKEPAEFDASPYTTDAADTTTDAAKDAADTTTDAPDTAKDVADTAKDVADTDTKDMDTDDTTKEPMEMEKFVIPEDIMKAAASGSASESGLDPADGSGASKRQKTNSEGKKRVTKADIEAKLRKKLEAEMEENLKKKLESEWQEKLDAAEIEAQKKLEEAESKHSKYKKKVGSERKQWAQEQSVTKSALENVEREKKDLQDSASLAEKKYTDLLVSTTSGSSIERKNPKELYELLMNRFINMYDMRKKASTASAQQTLESSARYQFEDNGGVWTDITSEDICDLLDGLKNSGEVVTYSSGSNNYKSTMMTPSDPHCDHASFIEQTNTSTGIVRKIRKPGLLTQNQIDEATRKDTLFGNAQMAISISEVNMWMAEYNLMEGAVAVCEPSTILAELAEAFSAFGSGFKYTGAKKCATELFIKPLQLYQWLKYASCRGYTHMRLVLHGGNKEEYKAVKADPFGFNLRHAGRNGAAKGPGIYFGTSDHISCSYNTEGKDGTGLLGIVLCEQRWDSHVGSMTPYNLPPRSNANNPNAYSDTQGQYNAICVAELGLILPLGKVVSI